MDLDTARLDFTNEAIEGDVLFVARRGRASAVQVVAFGLGLTVLLLLTIVRTDLLEGWRATLEDDAPNHFMINIQPDERESIADIFRAEDIPAPEFEPLVRARMKWTGMR